jgi:hypothetical protein
MKRGVKIGLIVVVSFVALIFITDLAWDYFTDNYVYSDGKYVSIDKLNEENSQVLNYPFGLKNDEVHEFCNQINYDIVVCMDGMPTDENFKECGDKVYLDIKNANDFSEILASRLVGYCWYEYQNATGVYENLINDKI